MILKGKKVVITGGGRGIGAAIAHEFAKEGASLLLGARTLKQVNEVAESIRTQGGSAWAASCDVTREADVKAFSSAAAEHLGQVDILINNAGMADSAPLKSITLEAWNQMLSVNLTGVMLCTREFLPGMVERKWGRVVNIASIAGLAGAAYISAYAASKHGLMGFTRSVAAEVAKAGVTVNAVCPGYVQTPMTDETVDRIMEKTGLSREKTLANIETMNPQGRIIEPEEIAYVTRMLCDDRAKGINGQGVVVDGGSVLS